MPKSSLLNKEVSINRWILLGIPIIIILGTLLHFAYEWSGHDPIVGIFTPVNESVWEHLKLNFYPTLLWWLLGFILYRDDLSLPDWIFASTAALVFGPIITTTLYYTYTGTLGIHSVFIDVLIYIVSIIVSQLLGLHIYNNVHISKRELFIPLFTILLITLAFTIFTFYQPNLPIFIDPLSSGIS